jgi:hypothetical protein
LLFLGLSDADKTSNDRHGLAATVRGLPNDIHPPTMLF